MFLYVVIQQWQIDSFPIRWFWVIIPCVVIIPLMWVTCQLGKLFFHFGHLGLKFQDRPRQGGIVLWGLRIHKHLHGEALDGALRFAAGRPSRAR